MKSMLLALLLLTGLPAFALLPAGQAPALPEFNAPRASQWLNSAPLTTRQLHGQVVLLDVWTLGCSNCLNSIPWLKTLENRFKPRGLLVLGVHSPEFPHERGAARVLQKVRELGLNHPVLVDDRLDYWRALRARAWPSFYLIDKRGRLRAAYIGEVRLGDRGAADIEADIEALLAEP